MRAPSFPSESFSRTPARKQQRKPELAARLAEGKLQNAGCLGLDVEFDALGRVKIMDMELMFDSQVVTGH